MENLELVIFDMDGLLIDSETVYAKGWLYSLSKFGYNVSEEFIKKMAGQSTTQNTQDIAKVVGSFETAMEIRNVREGYYFEKVKNMEVLPMPFSLDLIEILKEKNIKIAVASSSCQKRVESTLNANKIYDKFDSITCGDDVENEKPHPDVYLKTIQKFNIDKSKIIALEDSVTGVNAAINAGIKVAMVNESNKRDYNFNKDYFLGYFKNLEEVYLKLLK